MPNYEEMYFKILRASEDAIRLLIRAQRECEERTSDARPYGCRPC